MEMLIESTLIRIGRKVPPVYTNVVKICSPIKSGEETELAQYLEAIIEKRHIHNFKSIIIDMKHCESISSGALGILINTVQYSSENNLRLYLARVGRKITKLLATTHLDTQFNIYQSLDNILKEEEECEE